MATETLAEDAQELGPEDAAAPQPGSDPASVEESAGAESLLKTEVEQLRSERDQLLDRLARLQAEFENARRRDVKERADVRDYAVQNAVEPFLSVMDNFQLALKAQGSADQLRLGVELILKQMEEALRGLQVQAVETVGTQFDPRIHEALGSIETAEFPDHQVVEEVRRGYKIREKLLRPALVKIAVNKAQVDNAS
ncbi:MAG TPA: nucleotide exchange factor GrpE [Acidobacteriaceae bacterium]